MSSRRIEFALWSVSLALALVAALGWRATPHSRDELELRLPQAASAPLFLHADSLDEIAVYAVEHDPFRMERRPSDVPYVPGAESAPSPPPAPPAPTLVLTGIMGGPPWQGIVEGFPGVSGSTVIRQGQLVGELRVVRVTEEVVVIESSDTTWTLHVRRGW